MIYKRVAAGLLVGLALLAFGAGYALAAEAPGHGGEPVNTNPLEFKNGRLTVPTGPGLGLELDENKLKEMTD